MSNLGLVITLQSELNELSRRRKSLESDVLILEQKINVVNQNLKGKKGNRKMMALKEFLETEKQRIQKNKLSRINIQATILENKIKDIRRSQANSSASENLEITLSQSSANEYLIRTTDYFQRPKSEQISSKECDFKRKYKSLPVVRPYTSNDSKTYCAYCQGNTDSVFQKKESFPIHLEHQKWTKTHLPICMSMDICKECTAMRDFFIKMKKKEVHDDLHKNCSRKNCNAFFNGKCDSPCNLTESKLLEESEATSSVQTNCCVSCKELLNQNDDKKLLNSNFNEETINPVLSDDPEKYKEMIKSCDSFGMCFECSKLQDKSLSTNSPLVGGRTNKTDIEASLKNSMHSKEKGSFYSVPFDDMKSLSPSILATCESYSYCECCNHNLGKINMPTPTSSIVEITCTSHANCSKCAEILLKSSRKNSLDQPSFNLISNEIMRNHEDLTKYHPRRKLYEEIRKEIEFQSHIIFNTEEQISKLVVLNESDERLFQLRNILEKENLKLHDMMKLAKTEERRPNEEVWWEKPSVTRNQ